MGLGYSRSNKFPFKESNINQLIDKDVEFVFSPSFNISTPKKCSCEGYVMISFEIDPNSSVQVTIAGIFPYYATLSINCRTTREKMRKRLVVKNIILKDKLTEMPTNWLYQKYFMKTYILELYTENDLYSIESRIPFYYYFGNSVPAKIVFY